MAQNSNTKATATACNSTLDTLVKNPPPAPGSLFLGVAIHSASGRDLTRVPKQISVSGKPTSRLATRHFKKTSRHFHFATQKPREQLEFLKINF